MVEEGIFCTFFLVVAVTSIHTFTFTLILIRTLSSTFALFHPQGYMPKKLYPDNHKPMNPSSVPQSPGSKFLPATADGHDPSKLPPTGRSGHAKGGPEVGHGPQAGGPVPKHGAEL
jgi:hypothetical protein